MGRRREHQSVESCWGLDVLALARAGYCAHDVRRAGLWQWQNRFGVVTASVMLVGSAAESPLAIRVCYTLSLSSGDNQAVNELLPIASTAPTYGGRRWWWLCRGCGVRRRWLHLTRTGLRFRCRVCHRLTYASSQASDKRVSALAQQHAQHPSQRLPDLSGMSIAALGLRLRAVTLVQQRMLRRLSPGRRERMKRFMNL